MNQQLERLSLEQKIIIEDKILRGVVSRASSLMFIWALALTLYGFTSLNLFRSAIPNISLWQNLWPRLVFNAIPALIFAFWYKRYQSNTKLKAYSTIFVFPSLLVASSSVHAWPSIFSGNYEFYFYLHTTNIVAFSSGLAILSAPPRLVLWQILGFLVIYLGPLLYLFYFHEPRIFTMIITDVTTIAIILYFGLRITSKLRFFMASQDILRKKALSVFLGRSLTKAIFESTEMKFANYLQEGLVMAIDLRGYTHFVYSYPSDVVKKFMYKFHSRAVRAITKNGGYVHKTSGDGLLVTFGIMERDEDLSEIASMTGTDKSASDTKKTICLQRAFKTFKKISDIVESLREELQIEETLVVGGGLDYGSIEVFIRGNEKYRQELDIDGPAIIKAVRMESFSKVLNNLVDKESSFMILDTTLLDLNTEIRAGLKMWLIDSSENQIRDYPETKSVLYLQRNSSRKRAMAKVA
jgi:class 3 adenylate cyclase